MADAKKQVPLRLSPQVYAELAAWAADDFRSVNGQIEYLLAAAVRARRRTVGQAGSDGVGQPGGGHGVGSPLVDGGPVVPPRDGSGVG